MKFSTKIALVTLLTVIVSFAIWINFIPSNTVSVSDNSVNVDKKQKRSMLADLSTVQTDDLAGPAVSNGTLLQSESPLELSTNEVIVGDKSNNVDIYEPKQTVLSKEAISEILTYSQQPYGQLVASMDYKQEFLELIRSTPTEKSQQLMDKIYQTMASDSINVIGHKCNDTMCEIRYNSSSKRDLQIALFTLFQSDFLPEIKHRRNVNTQGSGEGLTWIIFVDE